MALSELLVEYARENGIAALGIAPAEPLAETRDLLRERLEHGVITPFTAGDIDRRCDPRQVLSEARSVISIAVSYHAGVESGEDPPGLLTGQVARYAWGQDYHRVLRDKLIRLSGFLERNATGSAAARIIVDSGPMVERMAAARAGIGQYGENCSISVPGYGSWVLLGEIITNVDLAPTAPLASAVCDNCGECRRACPTGALPVPYLTVDRRCLSYISQMKGYLPREYRSRLGQRLWGCDTCQAACPRNREVAVTGSEEFRPRPVLGGAVDLADLLALSQAEFKYRYGASALAWRGRDTVQRNALVVLGNSRDPAALPALARALTDERPLIRGHAAWAAGQIGGAQAQEWLEQAGRWETDPAAAAEITCALAGQ